MKKFLQTIVIAAGCMVAAATFAATQQSSDQADQSNAPAIDRAANLDQLLQQVKSEQQAVAALNAKREREFRQARDQQQALLNKAKAEQKNVKQRGDQLQAQFNKNEQTLNDLTKQLAAREGNLGEVFGVVRQTAANLKGVVDSSLVSAQIPNRGQFLSRMASSQTLPSIKQLRKLWFMLTQQAVQEGKVVRFPSTITLPDGTQTQQQVVRVGGFNAIRGNDFLNYVPETEQLVVYAEQPSGDARDLAANLYQSKSGYQKIAIDPSRGQLLSLLIRGHKTFKQRLDDGGAVGYTIVVLFIIGILIALERIVALSLTSGKVKKQLKTNTPDSRNPLGRVLNVYAENPNDDVETLELKLDEAILKETPALEARLTMIKLIAAVGPLMGLLGTVIGMIITFEAITLFGTGNPAVMANGISTALVTTVEGLVTAIPLVLLHAYITSKTRGIIQILEEQSAGIIAAQAEKRK